MNLAAILTQITDMLDRCRPCFLIADLLLFIVGSMFWAFTIMGGDAMAPDTYGTFACQFDAELWAGALMAGTAMVMNGLIRPINNWMVAAGGAILCAKFGLLTYSAIFTGGEFVIGVFAGVFFLSWHVWLTLEALISNGRD